MTYRVVQVTEDHLDATGDGGAAVSVVSAAAFAGAQQAVAQVIMWDLIFGCFGIEWVCFSDLWYIQVHVIVICLVLFRET